MAGQKRKPKKKGRKPLILETRRVETQPQVFKDLTVGEHICFVVRTSGAYLKDAAAVCEVSESVVHKWRARGEEWIEEAETSEEPVEVPPDEVPYVEFVQSLKKAQGNAVVWHLTNIRRAATDDWKASAWYLERTRPDEYGRRDRHQIEGSLTLTDLERMVDEDEHADAK